MNIEKLRVLAQIDLSKFQSNEQNVKYNIVLAFLNCFGYDQLDLEHAAQGSRIDINIGNKIIVETKALDKNLDHYVTQVKQYCDNERPDLAILTNGRLFRFYSPFMRVQSFSETLLYEFQLKDFSLQDIVVRINKLIGYENYSNGTYLTYIEERENELKQVRGLLLDFDSKKRADIDAIQGKVEQIKSEIGKMNSELELKYQEIAKLKDQKVPEKEELYKKYFIPSVSSNSPIVTVKKVMSSVISPVVQPVSLNNSLLLKIETSRSGVLAHGKFYDNTKFTVLKGSTVSVDVDPTFGKGAADGAFQLRNELLKNGIINDNREFIEDYTFSSSSQAACVVLGGSRSGPREWKEVN